MCLIQNHILFLYRFHFVEYLKEFIPNLPDEIAPLRPYLKEGARFDDFLKDVKAQEAKRRLTRLVIDRCPITSPGFEAAGRPEESGRPFEIFSDASDYGWCCILTQRDCRGGTPKIVVVVIHSFFRSTGEVDGV